VLFFIQKLKLKYYQLMIELDQHDSAYLAVCKHYMAIYNTPMIKDDAVARNEVGYVCIMFRLFGILLSKR